MNKTPESESAPPACVDCDSPKLYARSRCNRCYLRHRKALKESGEFKPLLVLGMPLERLMAQTKSGPDGCVLFTGTLSKRGYGQISVDGVNTLAHRAAYTLTVGPIPDGMDLDHTCHNRDASCLGGPTCLHRRCVNVDHLEPVPGAENTRRGRGGVNNASKTHCPARHRYDSENTNLYDGRRYCRTCNGRRQAGHSEPVSESSPA